MEKTYKRVPFDIELAKKIQSGEVKGNISIIYRESILHLTSEVRYAEQKGFYLAYFRNEYVEFPIIFNTLGNIPLSESVVTIELPEQPKHEFKPFEQVLVRDGKGNHWKADYYSHTIPDKNGDYYSCVGNVWKYCIPYAGNEHLLGTTNEPK